MADAEFHQFKLRIEKQLFDRLSKSADRANRSVSAEIVTRLEQSYVHEPPPRDSRGELAAILTRLDEQHRDLESARRQVWMREFEQLTKKYISEGLPDHLAARVAMDKLRETTPD